MEELGLQALHWRVAGIDVHRMLHVVTVLIEQMARPDPSLALAWIKGGADLLQHKLEEFVVILTASLDKLRPGRSCPRNFGVNGAQRPRPAYR